MAAKALLLALPFRSDCNCVLGAMLQTNHRAMDVIKAIKSASDSSSNGTNRALLAIRVQTPKPKSMTSHADFPWLKFNISRSGSRDPQICSFRGISITVWLPHPDGNWKRSVYVLNYKHTNRLLYTANKSGFCVKFYNRYIGIGSICFPVLWLVTMFAIK